MSASVIKTMQFLGDDPLMYKIFLFLTVSRHSLCFHIKLDRYVANYTSKCFFPFLDKIGNIYVCFVERTSAGWWRRIHGSSAQSAVCISFFFSFALPFIDIVTNLESLYFIGQLC